MKRFYRETKNNFFNLALERCVKSDYVQGLCNTFPLTLLSITAKSVINWLIVSRVTTNYLAIDFPISLTITVALSYYSPIFYDFFNRVYGREVDQFSKYLLDSAWTEGWIYLETWKNRILASTTLFVIFTLFFVEISSRDIQLFLTHILISSAIVDLLTREKPVDPSWNRVQIRETPAEVLSRSHNSYENLPKIEDKKVSFKIIDDYQLSEFCKPIDFDSSD